MNIRRIDTQNPNLAISPAYRSLDEVDYRINETNHPDVKGILRAARLISDVNYGLSDEHKEYAVDMINEQIDDMRAGELAVVEDGEIVGAGAWRYEPGSGYRVAKLGELSVVRKEHLRGYGSALLQYIEETAAREGAQGMRLNALPDSVGFYQKYGYDLIDDKASGPTTMGKRL